MGGCKWGEREENNWDLVIIGKRNIWDWGNWKQQVGWNSWGGIGVFGMERLGIGFEWMDGGKWAGGSGEYRWVVELKIIVLRENYDLADLFEIC